MIVLDTSAVIALILGEPSAPALTQCLALDAHRAMSTASYLEAGAVLAGRSPRRPLDALDHIEAFVTRFAIELCPVDEEQARIALDARIRYGRGMGHGGVLNLRDAFSYALAKSLDAPLLYVGRDFATTDIKLALG